MRRARLPLLGLVLLAACSRGEVPTDDLALRIDSDAFEVELARGFPLTVTRSWSRAIVPEWWSDETLSPLIVRLVDVERRESDSHVLETRHYLAFAPELGDVRVLPPLFVGRRLDGGGEVVFSGEALDVRVGSALPSDDASEVELPGGMLRPRRPWPLWAAGLGALVVVALLTGRVLRSRPASEAEEPRPGPPPEGPDVVALRALDAAEALLLDDDPRRLCDAVSDALRGYVRRRFGIGSPESTSRELIDAARAATIPRADVLRDLLTRCDLVRFARAVPDAEGRARILADARALVTATAGGAS